MPPFTVASLAITITSRPETRPTPVINPAEGEAPSTEVYASPARAPATSQPPADTTSDRPKLIDKEPEATVSLGPILLIGLLLVLGAAAAVTFFWVGGDRKGKGGQRPPE